MRACISDKLPGRVDAAAVSGFTTEAPASASCRPLPRIQFITEEEVPFRKEEQDESKDMGMESQHRS